MNSKVYFTTDLSPAAMLRLYDALGVQLPGKVAVKLHSGEPGNQNFLRPDFMKPMIDKVGGTIVECNTAYDGGRNTTAAHWETMKKHGWSDAAAVDILDEKEDMELAVPGGKVIQKICADCNVKIDINDDGDVFVAGTDSDGVRRALSIIETIVNDPEIGAIYKGRVTRLMNFGAFVELAPGKEGMVHISKLDMGRVEKVEDVVAVGDEVIVKVTDIDQQGRINLSRRDALIAMEAKKNAAKQ